MSCVVLLTARVSSSGTPRSAASSSCGHRSVLVPAVRPRGRVTPPRPAAAHDDAAQLAVGATLGAALFTLAWPSIRAELKPIRCAACRGMGWVVCPDCNGRGKTGCPPLAAATMGLSARPGVECDDTRPHAATLRRARWTTTTDSPIAGVRRQRTDPKCEACDGTGVKTTGSTAPPRTLAGAREGNGEIRPNHPRRREVPLNGIDGDGLDRLRRIGHA